MDILLDEGSKPSISTKNMKKKAIFVNGIFFRKFHKENFEKNIKPYFEKNFDVFFYSSDFYFFSQTEKIISLKNKIENEIENSKEFEITLFAHSYGGIILGSIDLNKFENIEKIVLIASPLSQNWFLKKIKAFDSSKKYLGYSQENFIKEKTHTIGFWGDSLVPFFITKIKFATHKNYFADHVVRLFCNKKFAEKVLSESLEK